jgi:tetratricopeptide (TPR) repeat protein
MSDSGRAVFLSYASQDTEAARRIAEALRAAGVEVWFDQSELRGGDAWDQKIRRQIKECALFVPVISANTQSRPEGYFRLEWRLAEQRTHLMGRHRAFVLPVCVDSTSDVDADVPDAFSVVQWTWVSSGDAASAFAERVKRLLGGDVAPVSDQRMGANELTDAGRRPALLPKRVRSPWLVPALISAIAGVALAVWQPWRKPAPAATMPASHSEVAQLVARAREFMGKADPLRSDLDTAAVLLEQAAKQDAMDVTAAATLAELDARYMDELFDNSPQRLDSARRHAAQAIGLDPGNREARFANVCVMVRLAQYSPASCAAAEKILRPMLTEAPDDGRVPLELGSLAQTQGRFDEALDWFDRAAREPGMAGSANYLKAFALLVQRRLGDAERAVDQALNAENSPNLLMFKSWLVMSWEGDLEAARKIIAASPPQILVEDQSATVIFILHFWRRDYEQALDAMRAVPHDYLMANPINGPTGYFKGLALAGAGRPAAAQIEWHSALETVDRRLAAEPTDTILLHYKALLLVHLGQRDAGEQVWKASVELNGDTPWGWEEPALRVQFLPAEQSIEWLTTMLKNPPTWLTAAALRLDPTFDPLRGNPRFAVLLAQAEADPRLSPKAKETKK